MMTLDETVRVKDQQRTGLLKDQQRARLLEALIACTQEMLSGADKTDASEYVRLQMNLQSFSEEYKTLTGRDYRLSGR
jgi:hypothetical protein